MQYTRRSRFGQAQRISDFPERAAVKMFQDDGSSLIVRKCLHGGQHEADLLIPLHDFTW